MADLLVRGLTTLVRSVVERRIVARLRIAGTGPRLMGSRSFPMRFQRFLCLGLAALFPTFSSRSEAKPSFRFANQSSKPACGAFVRSEPGREGSAQGETMAVQGPSIAIGHSDCHAESNDRTREWTSDDPAARVPQPAGVMRPNVRKVSFRNTSKSERESGPGGIDGAATDPMSDDGSAPSSDSTRQVDDPMGELPTTAPSPSNPAPTNAATPPTATPWQGPRGMVLASPHPVIVTQPDGNKVALRIQGDERQSWQVDLNGYPVLKTDDGRYVYAIVDPRGQLKATEHIVGKANATSVGIKKYRPGNVPSSALPPASSPVNSGAEEDPMGDLSAPDSEAPKRTSELLPRPPTDVHR